jgi:signal transduction histidine kinase
MAIDHEIRDGLGRRSADVVDSELAAESSLVSLAMAAVRDDLGFETATLFAPGPSGWELLDREGPSRPWHAVLDPGVLEGTPEAAEYRDVRAVPGVGERLASMGCASIAVLPLPDGSRLLLDSAARGRSGGWIERARPYLAMISIMSGPVWPVGGALRSQDEVRILELVFEICQEVLAQPAASIDEVLWRVRDLIRADEVFLLVDEEGSVEVRAVPVDGRPESLPAGALSTLSPTAGGIIPDQAMADLSLALATPSRALAGAVADDGSGHAVLVAGWAEGPALSHASMLVVARAVGTTDTALRARHRAVSTMFDRERSRLAYALHDGVTQTVAGAVLELEALAGRIEESPTEALATLDSSKAEIRRSLSDLRSILFELAKDSEEDEQPSEPLIRYVEDVMKRWRLPARITVEGDLGMVPPRVLGVAYVVVREGLANAAKHAGGRGVAVQISAAPEALSVTVTDRGRGFSGDDEAAARDAHHFGLQMLRKRVTDAGGDLRVSSAQGRGTRVVARLPYLEVTQ